MPYITTLSTKFLICFTLFLLNRPSKLVLYDIIIILSFKHECPFPVPYSGGVNSTCVFIRSLPQLTHNQGYASSFNYCVFRRRRDNHTMMSVKDGWIIWHYCDVIKGAMASQNTSLTIVYSIVNSGNIKAPRHCPLCGEFTGDRWIPRTNGQ